MQKESEFYQSMDRVLCVSQGVKEVADRLFKLKGNSQVLYNLIDRDKICRKAKEENVEKQKFTIVMWEGWLNRNGKTVLLRLQKY